MYFTNYNESAGNMYFQSASNNIERDLSKASFLLMSTRLQGGTEHKGRKKLSKGAERGGQRLILRMLLSSGSSGLAAKGMMNYPTKVLSYSSIHMKKPLPKFVQVGLPTVHKHVCIALLL